MSTMHDLSPDLSAEARSAKVDRLDTAIDHVAARLVRVQENAEITARIVGALPERPRFRWLIPQFAAIAAVAIAAVVWTTRDSAAPSLLPSSKVAAVMVVPNMVTAVEPGTVFKTQPLEPLEPLEPLAPLVPLDVDFDRSLAPIEVMSALVVSDLGALELPAASALVVAPIAITDLPLTAESFSPR